MGLKLCVSLRHLFCPSSFQQSICIMAPMKKAVAGKSISKTEIAKTIAGEFELKNSTASKIIDSIAATAAKEVKKNGKFHLPGLLHGEDSRQAGYQGWPEGDLRQDGDGEGEARTHRREGVPRVGFEEERLRVHTCTLVHTRALTCQFAVEIYGIARRTEI